MADHAWAGEARFVSVAAGDAFVCALTEEGRVWCWGDNRDGEAGGGSEERFLTAPAAVAGLDGVVQVAAARHWAAAVRRDGTVWTWGRDGFGIRTGNPQVHVRGGPPTQVQGLDRVQQVALGELHGCARRDDGSVWCWGSDQDGRLGDAGRFLRTAPALSVSEASGPMPPTTPARSDLRFEPSFSPAPVPGVGPASWIGAYGECTAAVVGGEVWIWGTAAAHAAASGGRPGSEPTKADEVVPRRIAGASGVRTISVGAQRLLAVHADRTVSTGALSEGALAPVPGLEEVVEGIAGSGGVVRTAEGLVRAWGVPAAIRGDGSSVFEVPSRLALDAVALAAGRAFVVAVDRAGAVWGWGTGWAGQLGAVPGRAIGEGAVWVAERPLRIVGPPPEP